MNQSGVSENSQVNDAGAISDTQLATFEAAIAQLHRLMLAGVSSPTGAGQQSSNIDGDRLRELTEKYEKIERMVLSESDAMEIGMGDNDQLRSELQEEYHTQQKTITQGKRDILQLTLVTKQAMQFQNAGSKALQRKQLEAERLMQQISKLEKDIQAINAILHDKFTEENRLEAENQRSISSIEEFRRDQNDQKAKLELTKQSIAILDQQINGLRRECLELNRKLESTKKKTIETLQKIEHSHSSREVSQTELKNERRTLLANERRFEEISFGLNSIVEEMEKGNKNLEQIRLINANLKEKLVFNQNSLGILQDNSFLASPETEELQMLEGLLQQQSAQLAESERLLVTKDAQKSLLTEHLDQLNIFAEQYLAQQAAAGGGDGNQNAFLLQQQHSDRLQTQTTNQQENISGMECIQSLYEQEQDSQTSPNIDHFHAKNISAGRGGGRQQNGDDVTAAAEDEEGENGNINNNLEHKSRNAHAKQVHQIYINQHQQQQFHNHNEAEEYEDDNHNEGEADDQFNDEEEEEDNEGQVNLYNEDDEEEEEYHQYEEQVQQKQKHQQQHQVITLGIDDDDYTSPHEKIISLSPSDQLSIGKYSAIAVAAGSSDSPSNLHHPHSAGSFGGGRQQPQQKLGGGFFHEGQLNNLQQQQEDRLDNSFGENSNENVKPAPITMNYANVLEQAKRRMAGIKQ